MDRDALLNDLERRHDEACERAAAALRAGAELFIDDHREPVANILRDFGEQAGEPEFGVRPVGDYRVLGDCPHDHVRTAYVTVLNPDYERWLVFLAPEVDQVVACIGAVPA